MSSNFLCYNLNSALIYCGLVFLEALVHFLGGLGTIGQSKTNVHPLLLKVLTKFDMYFILRETTGSYICLDEKGTPQFVTSLGPHTV